VISPQWQPYADNDEHIERRTSVANSRSAGLYLTVEAASGPAILARLGAALDAAPIASVLILPGMAGGLDASRARPLVELVQARKVAALIADDAALARALRSDGVHLTHSETLEARFREAREVLGNRYIAGGDAGGSRHDAMNLGEQGADYVAFAGANRDELTEWWAQIFEIPCVAFAITAPHEAAHLARLGADFLGFALPHGAAAEVQAAVRAVAGAAAHVEAL
jgi:thiamine-phosphate pyrophosphorylase